MIGTRVGSLTVEARAGTSQLGHVWLCRCDCGGSALRTTAALRRARVLGRSPGCRRCVAARSARAGIDRHRGRVAIWRGLWRDQHTLWSDDAILRLCFAVREDVAADMGNVAEDVRLPAEVMPSAFTEPPDVVADGPSDPGYVYTHEEIGDAIGCSRSRAQQIEMRALWKLRKAFRKIDPLLFEEGWRHLEGRSEVVESALERAHDAEAEEEDDLDEALPRARSAA